MRRLALIVAIVGGLSSLALAQPGAAAPAKERGPAQRAIGAGAPGIYDEQADAKAQVASALKKAKKENTRVLIQWGYNACGWCRLLHEKFAADPGLTKELMNEYQLVLIDCSGRNKQNLDLAASYGADVARHGFPFLTVLDASGKALANQETESLELKDEHGKSITGEGMGHDAAKVVAFLKEHEAAHLQADAVLKEATDQARATGKKVFLHFGAPWCVWCHRLDNWLARPDVEPLIAKDFVEVKIDQDRMVGGKEVEARVGMPASSGIPWFVFQDPTTGKAVADSTGPGGNIGFPAADEEISHFMGMLEKARKNLTAADLERLKQTLVEEQKKIKSPAH